MAPARTHAVTRLTRTVTTIGQKPRSAAATSSIRAARVQEAPKARLVYQSEPTTSVDAVARRTAQMLMSGIITPPSCRFGAGFVLRRHRSPAWCARSRARPHYSHPRGPASPSNGHRGRRARRARRGWGLSARATGRPSGGRPELHRRRRRPAGVHRDRPVLGRRGHRRLRAAADGAGGRRCRRPPRPPGGAGRLAGWRDRPRPGPVRRPRRACAARPRRVGSPRWGRDRRRHRSVAVRLAAGRILRCRRARPDGSSHRRQRGAAPPADPPTAALLRRGLRGPVHPRRNGCGAGRSWTAARRQRMGALGRRPVVRRGPTGTGASRPARGAPAAGGLAPGAGWAADGVSWTPTTAVFALTAAASGQVDRAESWLDWLDAHRTPRGALPEKVLADGSPSAVAPLAWTCALVLLTLDELGGGSSGSWTSAAAPAAR